MVRRVWMAAFLIVAIASTVMADKNLEFESLWELEGFDKPESVMYDSNRDVLYVSNVVGKSLSHDDNGFISRVSMQGEMLEREWITGLDAPRGMLIKDDMLWVADLDCVVKIDIEQGKVKKDIPIKGASLLNDIAADDDGNIYVSDLKGNIIFKHTASEDKSEGEGEEFFKRWVETTSLRSPNGLYVDGEHLIVASWGISGSAAIRVKGHLKKISLKTGKIRKLGSGKPIGHLDGIQGTGDGSYLVTEWKHDDLLLVSSSGSFTSLLDLESGPADLEYIPEKGMVIIPIMNANKVQAFKKKAEAAEK